MWATRFIIQINIGWCLVHPYLNLMVEGRGFEPLKPVRAAILQTAPINHSGTPPGSARNVSPSPRGESNPLTYRLQIGCAAIALLGHSDTIIYLLKNTLGEKLRKDASSTLTLVSSSTSLNISSKKQLKYYRNESHKSQAK
jgi:hypothetical protein